MLPVNQTDNVQIRVELPRNNDIAWLEVGMADAVMTEIPGMSDDAMRRKRSRFSM